jgi:hypothetical protein
MCGRVGWALLARYSREVVKTSNSLHVYWSCQTRRLDNAESYISVRIEELCRKVPNCKGRNLKRKPSNILRRDDVFLVTRNFTRCVFFLGLHTVSCNQLEAYSQVYESMTPKWGGCTSFGHSFSDIEKELF